MISRIKKYFMNAWFNISHNFIIIGIASFIWLIYKTGTKPSRITYPCQQAALANAGFLVYLLPAFYISRLTNLRKKDFQLRLLMQHGVKAVILLAIFFVAEFAIGEYKAYRSMQSYLMSAKGPAGVKAAGGSVLAGLLSRTGFASIPSALLLPSPHRVVSVHDSDASTWGGSCSPHSTMNQGVIDSMVAKGLMELTGKSTAQEAWAALVPYKSGEAVAVKLNFNNDQGSWSSDHYMNPYAEVVKSVIAGLNSIGVPSDKIWLTDPSRVIPDAFRNRVNNSEVRYFVGSTLDIGSRANVYRTGFVADDSVYATTSHVNASQTYRIRPAQVFIDAAHIINIPQLKGHGGASITLGLKNHFGSIFINNAQGNSDIHNYFYCSSASHNLSEYNLLGDIQNNPVFRDKTRLIIGDGIMGHSSINYQPPHVWTSYDGNPPETLFFAVDPVAVDSVMTDYLNRENSARSEQLREDDLMVYAASIGLGVFEHWDGPDTRNYSGTGIDYVEVDLDTDLCKNCNNDTTDSFADLTVADGKKVNVVIKGLNCDDNSVTLEYSEIDNGSGESIPEGHYNLPADAVFTNGTATVSWTAVWFEENGGKDTDPEIQFTAKCGGTSRVSNILKIVK